MRASLPTLPPAGFIEFYPAGVTPPAVPRFGARLAAVEDVLAEILHFEDGRIGPSGRRLGQMRLDHLADNDVMVAFGKHRLHPAFDRAGRLVEERRAGGAR